jgi:3-hydroxyisobutyrate dehydrogenase-like beta-hydroxyacid dehydrogenase
MGYALVSRLLRAGHDVAVYNRTRAKAEPLAELGAVIVDSPADLGDRDIVFTMVAGPKDFKEVVLGPEGILSGARRPGLIVDSTTVSPATGEEVRAAADELGVALLAAPVSGNPKVVEAGRLTMCVSGPSGAWHEARAYLEVLAHAVTYVGDGERARLVKICHNLMLGVVTQNMAEITVLAERGGVSRAAFLEFLNNSVMGSIFTRYKTPAFVHLDYSPTFTPLLLRKDFDLGLAAAHDLDVPMPTVATTAAMVQATVSSGRTDEDFAVLLDQQAALSGVQLKPEDAHVDDGLAPDQAG